MAEQRKCRKCDTAANHPVFLRKKKTVRGKEVFDDTPTNEYQCDCGRSVFSGNLTTVKRSPIYVDHIED
jgi:hypothetical protein